MPSPINTENRATSLGNSPTPRDQLGIAPTELQHTLKLAGLLQTSLEIETVLEYFIEATHDRLAFDAVQFGYKPLSISLQFGARKRHTCSYRLKLAGEFLGELIFSRRHRFTDEEMELLEGLLCQLIYPLRNAVWYQTALLSAQLDPLTSINNRASMDTNLQREVNLAHRNRTPLSLFIADIDHFKNINDHYGHSIGDVVLREFAQLVAENLRGCDILFRYGGEEFVVLLTGTNLEDAVLVAERVRSAVESHMFNADELQLPISASFGTATLNSSDTPQSLFNKADSALYNAKESGRNQVLPYQEDFSNKQQQAEDKIRASE